MFVDWQKLFYGPLRIVVPHAGRRIRQGLVQGVKAGSEEVRPSALLRGFSNEMPITTMARSFEPACNCGTAAKERRIRAPLRYPAHPHDKQNVGLPSRRRGSGDLSMNKDGLVSGDGM